MWDLILIVYRRSSEGIRYPFLAWISAVARFMYYVILCTKKIRKNCRTNYERAFVGTAFSRIKRKNVIIIHFRKDDSYSSQMVKLTL